MRNDDECKALAMARAEFFASLSGATLEGAPSGKYLRNRLELAFVAGWDARGALVVSELNALLAAPAPDAKP